MERRISILALFLLAGCASPHPAPVSESGAPTRIEAPRVSQPTASVGKVYVVRKGDTLNGIAREHGLDPRDIAAWNDLGDANRISVGQTLRLTPPGAPPATAAASSPETTEVQPIIGGGAVVARPLEGAPAGGAVSPAPSLAPGGRDAVKRAPKGGKLPYSEENLARLSGQGGMVTAPAAQAASPSSPSMVAPQASAPKPAAAATALPASGIGWGWPASGKLLAGFSDGSGAKEINRGIDIAGKIGDPVRAAAAGKVIFVGVYPKHGNLVVLLHADGYSSVYAHNSRILVKEGQMVERGDKIAELGDSDADRPKLHFELRHKGKPLDPLKLLPAR
ncbi:MAG: peptidoglycan DD-metalloendopeptidase family protein [Rhodocyclaceae bacterium]